MNRTLTRLEQTLLIAAPLVMIAGGLLLVRYDDQDWPGVLTAMAAHPVRSDTGWLLMLLGAALATAPTYALARLVGADRPRLAATAIVTTSIGWASVPAFCMGGITMQTMAQADDRQQMVDLLTELNSGRSSVVFLAAAVGAVGYIVLAVGLARTRTTPTTAAVLTGLGGAGTFLVMPGPIRSLLILALLLLLAGHAWTAARTRTPAEKHLAPAVH